MPEPTASEVHIAWWRTTWPIDRAAWIRVGWSFAAVVTVGAVLGLLLYRWFPSNAVVRLDERITDWLVAHRTDGWTSVASWGARLADTPVKIGISVVACAIALWRWRRWREALLIALSLTFEASAFIITSFIVGRPRPDVEPLLDSPVDTSFPSGHVAAATVYGAFVVILFWHVRSPTARAAAIVACAAVVTTVGASRMYQGMHYFSDVVGGIVLGVTSLVVCTRILGPPDDAVGRSMHEVDSAVTV